MKTILFNTHDLTLIFTLYQCLLFALFLLTLKKGKKLSNYLLASFLVCHAAIPLDNLINFGEAFSQVALSVSPNLFYSFGLAYWLEAPLLLLYIRSLIYKDYQLTKRDMIYFIPFVLYAIYFVDGWLLLPTEAQMAALTDNSSTRTDWLEQAEYLIREVIRFAFTVMCLWELRHYQRHIQQQVGELESVNLSWLKILVLGFLVIRIGAIVVALAYTFARTIGVDIGYEFIGLATNYLIMFLISGLIFFSAGYSTLFKGLDRKLDVERGKMSADINPRQVESITQYIVEKRPYLNPLLTLDNLASQLELAPRTLSMIINGHFDKNFYEFINGYRVQESQRILAAHLDKKITMIEVMEQAGFNSKATFNTFFKKTVGMTPTQYRKELLNT